MGKSTLNRCPRGEEILELPFREQYLHAEDNIITVNIRVNELHDRVGGEGRKEGTHYKLLSWEQTVMTGPVRTF